MCEHKLFYKFSIPLIMLLLILNQSLFATDTKTINKISLNHLSETAINSDFNKKEDKNTISWNDIKKHKIDLSIEAFFYTYHDVDLRKETIETAFTGYLSYTYAFQKSLCSFYTRLRFGIGGWLWIIPLDVAFGIRLTDLKYKMQYDLYILNFSIGPILISHNFLPCIAFLKSGIDIRFKNIVLGTYISLLPRFFVGLNLGYSFDL